MGKKAKTEAPKSEPVAPVSESKPLGGGVLAGLAFMKKAGATSEEKVSATGDKVEISLDGNAVMQKDVEEYLEESVKIDAANGRRKAIGERLRAFVGPKFFEVSRRAKQYITTVSILGKLNVYFHTQVKIPTKKDTKLTKEQMYAGLVELFGEEKFKKYVQDSLVIEVAPEYATPAGLEALQNKLGLAEFQKYFPTYELGLMLKREGPKVDDPILLKKDMLIDPIIQKMVETAEERGLLSLSEHTLFPLKEGKAVAEEKLLKEEIEIDALRQKAGKSATVEVTATAKAS